jgi:hypothetical protein
LGKISIVVINMKNKSIKSKLAKFFCNVGLLCAFSHLAPLTNISMLAQESSAQDQKQTQSVSQLTELERNFKDTLTNSKFAGYWRLRRDGQLTEAKKETYTIKNITKVTANSWIIEATIQYGTKNVTVPVPVQVEWADDTPVISVTRLGIPGLGTYSARVLVYDNCYSGVWSGPDYGGLLSGVIIKNATQLSGEAKP